MQALMMDMPLTITSIMQHADNNHPDAEIVSITADNPQHCYRYGDAFARIRRLANALHRYGIKPGERIGTLAWNDYRHFELYYAISGIGAITHTINPRLFPEQLCYIINHAEDRIVFVDILVLPLLEKLRAALKSLEFIVVLCDDKHLPETTLDNIQSYESFIAGESDAFDWPALDEGAASSLCYTSGTTGHPKGVLYSHRSTVLHAMTSLAPDVLGLSAWDVAMPVVPMFHVNAWGLPYAAPITGSKMVFPGPKMGDGEALQRLIEAEAISVSAGVPTVWLALLDYLARSGKALAALQRVIVGGSACPLSIITEFREKYGVSVHHGWGMTEMSPIGAVNTLLPGMEKLSPDELDKIRMKQGRAPYGIEMKLVDDEGRQLAHDGKQCGMLKVRGPWVCRAYYNLDEEDHAHDEAGWFSTGDIGNIDAKGYLQLTDRAKDVIKSGGEWISSIDLENAAVGHPQVAEAAVIGVPHPKWVERPLLIIVKNENEEISKEALLKWLEDKVAKWWLPDDVVFVDAIPHTATGKILKTELREQFKDYCLPDV